jgi:hypothetical protein
VTDEIQNIGIITILLQQQMPKIALGTKWGESEKGRYGPRKRDDRRWRLRFPTRRSALLTLVGFFFFAMVVTRRVLQSQFETLNDLLSTIDSKTSNKFAIVTIETRDVTYWRESLGNKATYARRHG